jgi:hypothetical protein
MKTLEIKDECLCEDGQDFFDYSTIIIGYFKLEHNYITLCGDKRNFFVNCGFNEVITTSPKVSI